MMDKASTTPASNQTAEKVILVLEALARQNQPTKLIDLSREVDMNTSTLYRFLMALQNTGYVVQHESNGKYELNLKLCQLADLVKSHFSISNVLHPFVVEASELFHESAHLAQVDRDKIVYVDNVTASSQSLMIRHYIGNTAPMHCTGIGKLFLSEYSSDQLDGYISREGLPSYTEHTFSTRDSLLNELQGIRNCGYSYDNEECEIGVRCIAVPIRDYSSKIVAGLSISGPILRVTDALIQKNLSGLLDIANRASFNLSYTGLENKL